MVFYVGKIGIIFWKNDPKESFNKSYLSELF